MGYCSLEKDHPRLRGEQKKPKTKRGESMGSPPLARGTGTAAAWAARIIRITPACAGNSMRAWRMRANGWDHPRLRGEQFPFSMLILYNIGSPPLARGTAVLSLFALPAVGSPPLARGTAKLSIARWYDAGITPACAGNRSQIGLIRLPQ